MAVSTISFGPAITAGGASLTETSGPTTLTLGSIADGLALKRVGTGIVGYAPGSVTLIETSGPDTLTLGSIANGLTLKRVGTEIVGYTPSSSGAPSTSTYIVQTADAGLSAEQALASLATGIVKNTTATGVLSIAVAGTDYVAPGTDAPANAQYLTLATDATLTVERVFTVGAGLTAVDAGAGSTYTITDDSATGKAGGLTITGGTGTGENLTLQSTAHATKGKVYLGSALTVWSDGVVGNPRFAVDGTGLTTTIPALIKTGKNLTGLELQATGSVAVGMLLRDSAGTQGAAVGLARANNDFIATSGAQTGALAGDLVLRSNVGGVHLSAFDGTPGIRMRGGSTYSRLDISDGSGIYIQYNTASMLMTSRSSFVSPVAIEATTSLTNVTLQVAGDVNTGIAPVGGADTLSIVCGGVEQMRVTTTLLTLNPKISFFTAQTQATVGANGAAAALTALPLGYMKFDVNGTAVVVPYYNA
jgi:hypothetical protein